MTSILKADNIQDADGNNIINESSNTITIGASGDTTNVIGTLNKDGVAVENTPAFMATASAQLTLSNDTWTKVQFNTEVVDTDSCYDNSSNYRFTPTTSGKYKISYFASMETTGGVGTANFAFFGLYKNGSVIHQAYIDSSNNNTYAYAGGISAIVDMNGSSDYLEAYARGNASSGAMKVQNSTYTMFGGFKLIGV
jgi:hypothetical protein